MSPHIVPVRYYVGVFVALLVLTALTTYAAYINLGPFNTVVAMTVAVTKMFLVMLIFMHLKYSSGMVRIIVGAGFLWLSILVALVMADVRTRGWTPQPGTWDPSIASSTPR